MTSSALKTSSSTTSAHSGAFSSGANSSGASVMAGVMASAASVIPASLINLTNQITVKLSSDNYLYWRTQVVPILRNNLMFEFVDGSLPNQRANTVSLACIHVKTVGALTVSLAIDVCISVSTNVSR